LTNNELYQGAGEDLSECLYQVSQGNQAAFAQLLRKCWNKVYTQAITYLKDASLAQEITQDVFVKIWSARAGLPAVENFSNYLFIVSRNEIVSALRKKGQGFVNPGPDIEGNLVLPDEQLQYKEFHHRLLQAIEELPPARKRVFKMSRLEGRSYDDIARDLGISRNGVKDHIVKALNFLRTRLAFAGPGNIILLYCCFF
jgi:RNA polymerase sigma-70 factor (family 1)